MAQLPISMTTWGVIDITIHFICLQVMISFHLFCDWVYQRVCCTSIDIFSLLV